MTPSQTLRHFLDLCPLVAIIRGVMPDDAEAIGDAIFAAGIRIIEVPLNSTDPLASILKLTARFGEQALIGAGTVLEVGQVAAVKAVGGRLIVAPDANSGVIAATAAAGLVSCPGFFTPTEAFAALRAGAHGLKLFPADGASPAMLKAQRAVLPSDVPVLPVGGIRPDTMRAWLDAGADGFGLGSALYQAGQSAADTAAKAQAFVAGLNR
ncbi:MAG: 2-dehydro-3-deoxy-6-phosphogalactonate aldolase [Sphingomicrobium sp.]